MNKVETIRLAEPLEKMYADCTTSLIENIAKHLKISDSMTDPNWRIHKLSELGQLKKENAAIIAKMTGKRTSEVESALKASATESALETDALIGAASKLGFVSMASGEVAMSAGMANAIQMYSSQATDKLNLVNTVMLNSSSQQFRWAVNNIDTELGKARLAAIQKAFGTIDAADLQAKLNLTQELLNNATGSVVLGTDTITHAVSKTVKTLADNGITGFIDAAGHHWSPEAYVMMDIRTTVHNTAIEAQKQRSAEHGVSTFQISSHAGARPLCEPYQGYIYSWDGTSGVVYDLYDNEYDYEPIENTSYGEPAGIFGINCGHDPITFVDGYSIPRYEPTEDKEANDKLYQETQEQRALERSVRDAKREALAAKAAGDDEGFKKASQKIKDREAKLAEYTKAHNLTERAFNTSVSGYNRSVASAVNMANRQAAKQTVAQTVAQAIVPDATGAMRGIPKGSPMSYLDAATKANPKYAESVVYRTNCANCAVTEELRMRGYDVEANPYNKSTKISHFWDSGKKGTGSWTDSFVEKMPAQYVGAMLKDQQIKKIQEVMDGWGKDSRAVVFVQWDGKKVGHYFNAINTADGVKFVNPQNPTSDAMKYFKYTSPSKTALFRTDDKTIDEYVRKVVTWTGKE